jgi:hypothetical protein
MNLIKGGNFSLDCFKSGDDFNTTVRIIKGFAENNQIVIDKGLLIIEIPAGVFIRTSIEGVSRFYSALTKAGYTDIGEKIWRETTRDLKSVDNLFGDDSLIIYKPGF